MRQWLEGTQPIARLGAPEDIIAPLAVFLAGSGSDYITGQVIAVDGGFSTTSCLAVRPAGDGAVSGAPCLSRAARPGATASRVGKPAGRDALPGRPKPAWGGSRRMSILNTVCGDCGRPGGEAGNAARTEARLALRPRDGETAARPRRAPRPAGVGGRRLPGAALAARPWRGAAWQVRNAKRSLPARERKGRERDPRPCGGEG